MKERERQTDVSSWTSLSFYLSPSLSLSLSLSAQEWQVLPGIHAADSY